MGRKIDQNSGRQARAARERELAESKKPARQKRVDMLTARIAGELLAVNDVPDKEERELVKAVVRFVVQRLVPPLPTAALIAGTDEMRQKLVARGDIPPGCNMVACNTDGYGLFLRLFDILFNLTACQPPQLLPPSPALVSLLMCPQCKGALSSDADGFYCAACNRHYPR